MSPISFPVVPTLRVQGPGLDHFLTATNKSFCLFVFLLFVCSADPRGLDHLNGKETVIGVFFLANPPTQPACLRECALVRGEGQLRPRPQEVEVPAYLRPSRHGQCQCDAWRSADSFGRGVMYPCSCVPAGSIASRLPWFVSSKSLHHLNSSYPCGNFQLKESVRVHLWLTGVVQVET